MKDNVNLKRQFHELNDYIGDKKDIIKDLGMRVLEAKHNKEELFRDCSTFEVNYATSGSCMLN